MSAIQLWALEDFCACWPLNVCVLTGGLFLTFPVRYGAAKGSGLLMIKLPFTFDLSRPSAWHYKCRWPFAWSSLPLAVRDSARMNLLMAVEDLQGEKAWISCFASPFGFLFGGAFSCSLHLDKTVPVLGGGGLGVGEEARFILSFLDVSESRPPLEFLLQSCRY